MPFRTPQANRYASNPGAKPHKLHDTFAGSNEDGLKGESVAYESESEGSIPATPEDEVDVSFEELERESSIQRVGTHFYRMANVSIPDMPMTDVFLACPYGAVMPEFKVAAPVPTSRRV